MKSTSAETVIDVLLSLRYLPDKARSSHPTCTFGVAQLSVLGNAACMWGIIGRVMAEGQTEAAA